MEGVYKSSAVVHIKDDQGTEMTKVISGIASISSSPVHEHAIHVDNVVANSPKHRTPSSHLMEEKGKLSFSLYPVSSQRPLDSQLSLAEYVYILPQSSRS